MLSIKKPRTTYTKVYTMALLASLRSESLGVHNIVSPKPSYSVAYLGTYSMLWSAPYSHMFSKYSDAKGVKCIIRLAALQPESTLLVTGGHSAGVS